MEQKPQKDPYLRLQSEPWEPGCAVFPIATTATKQCEIQSVDNVLYPLTRNACREANLMIERMMGK